MATGYVAPLDRQGEIFVVVVHRYSQPEDAWGVHELTPGTWGPYHLQPVHTVGLFRERPNRGTYSLLTPNLVQQALSGAIPNAGQALRAGLSIEEIYEFIERQVIPLEWKEQWRAGDPDIRSRVEVWV